MTGTGRLLGEIGFNARRIAYGEPNFEELRSELSLLVQIDRAHLVMLTEEGLIPVNAATQIIRCIDDLENGAFENLRSRPAPRGLYMMYEGYLIEKLGEEIGGVLHAGRSRNDLNATMNKMRLREWLLEFIEQAVRLEAVLLSRARNYQETIMPIYTHFQPAMPSSCGYYFLGVATAVGREIDALVAAAGAGLRECPLGSSAVAGTDLPISPARTAKLLGFVGPTAHALDAVASRDLPLRLLGNAASLGVVLSRLANDLQLWSTSEFGLIDFPDRLVGASSAMPQKRNVFLLEHLKAKSGHAVGAWAGAASMMAAAPFSNSIQVGTEAMRAIWNGLQAPMEAVLLAQLLVSGIRPDAMRMERCTEDSFVIATSVANRLFKRGISFRAAHRMVGKAVRDAVAAGSTRLIDYGPDGWIDDADISGLTLPELLHAQSYGGGPGAFMDLFAHAAGQWVTHRELHMDWRTSLAVACSALDNACDRLR